MNRDDVRARAFTLIELLVVVAIIGVLLAMTAAAIVRVRAAASQAECGNNLRQIGLALVQHHDGRRVFPSNGGWDGKQSIKSTAGLAVYVSTTVYAYGKTYTWGVGDPALGAAEQTGSWAYAILPYLEQDNLHKKPRWDGTVPSYICPGRRANSAMVASADKYGSYEGGGWSWARIDYAANGRLIQRRPQVLSSAFISDGTSSTILAGEKVMDPADYTSGTWWWDEPFFLGGPDALARLGTDVLADKAGVNVLQNWGSAHPNIAQFLFADGSVRPLRFEAPYATVLALLTPAGGEVIEE